MWNVIAPLIGLAAIMALALFVGLAAARLTSDLINAGVSPFLLM